MKIILIILFLFLTGCSTLNREIVSWEKEIPLLQKRYEHGIIYKIDWKYINQFSANLVNGNVEFVAELPNAISFVYDVGGWPLDSKWVRISWKKAFF